ncbi:MAG: carboxylate--amine ligase [Myxococcales bacterium]|nr:MAG: carboxylate--amine ligase [Myxococcales bacterium]
MNVLFLSPAFPPTAAEFCRALAEQGVRVLGIGDEPMPADSAKARFLHHYVYEPRMGEYEALRVAVRSLIDRYGPIARVDSNGEHWLVAEAKLRDEFGIVGLTSESLAQQRSKLGMAALFERANIPYPPTISAAEGSDVRAFAKEHGYPLVFKPDAGSGARDTFRVNNDAGLEDAIGRQLWSHVVQPFIDAPLITYDGLTDREGRIVFATSHEYDTGIMQVREKAADGYYYSLRELPPGLEELGRRAVTAFDVRERFFHLELFNHGSGKYTGLEMNLRPPGGFTTDMMNAACDIDVYQLWAQIIAGRDVSGFRYERRFHTAHAGRRAERRYRLSDAQLRAELGAALFAEHGVPAAFADTMGDVAYLLRHADLQAVLRGIRLVQSPAA